VAPPPTNWAESCLPACADCIFAQNMVADNIKAVSAAITKSGREMIYSLSPGGENRIPQLVADAKEIAASVNIYRITGDWHGGNLEHHFQVAAAMSGASLIGGPSFNSVGSFPDLDMLNPYTNASSDPNFKAQMTFWAINRSPLICESFVSPMAAPAYTAADPYSSAAARTPLNLKLCQWP
jgi:hypothetical protein